ncbi:MAG: hypothetical protein ACKVUS_21715 [Saprospiraceae bacterium]
MTIDEQHIPTVRPAKPTEIIVSPGQLVQVLNVDAEEGAIPFCYFSFEHQPALSNARIDCQSPCLGSESNSTKMVYQKVDEWMSGVQGFFASEIMETSGLLDVAHQPLASLTLAERLRLQALYVVLFQREEVLVFDSPWAEDDTDSFILDLLRFLRQRHAASGILPAFVVRDCGDLPAISMLADRIWEVENGRVAEVETEWR